MSVDLLRNDQHTPAHPGGTWRRIRRVFADWHESMCEGRPPVGLIVASGHGMTHNIAERRSPNTTGIGDVPPKARILVAEDDQDVREALVELLHAEGYEVVSASNGVELVCCLSNWILRKSKDEPVEAIITDVRMPGLNGLSLVEGLRSSGWMRPIVVMTAFGDDTVRARVNALQDVVMFGKPFDPKDLERTVDRLLREASLPPGREELGVEPGP